jgi:hypothetical protein
VYTQNNESNIDFLFIRLSKAVPKYPGDPSGVLQKVIFSIKIQLFKICYKDQFGLYFNTKNIFRKNTQKKFKNFEYFFILILVVLCFKNIND